MVFVNTIITKDNEKESFSKAKITIMLFENLCNIGAPNIHLAEKLAFLIVDRVNANYSESISFEKLDEIIKDILLRENEKDLLQAYILRQSKPIAQSVDSDLKEKILKFVLDLSDQDSLNSKLINLNSELNKLQNNEHESINKKIFDYIREGVFYPSSKILKNINQNNHFSSSFSFTINDTFESIFDNLSLSSKVQKYGASVAIDLSNIRSEKDLVKSVNKKACGPLKIIDLFSSAKSMIGYSPNTSNNLFYISIEHPDIIQFINHSNEVDNFAILVPNRFISNYLEDQEYFVEQNTKKIKINPTNIFDHLCSRISFGDNINLIFSDNVLNKNPISETNSFNISSVGYQPLLDKSSFVSGVIDVSKMINVLGNTKTINWALLKSIIWDSIEFLDNVIDLSNFVNDDYKDASKQYRQIYLSITGFATLLSKLNIPYNSDDALLLADSFSSFIAYYSKIKSTDLAKERGPFLKYVKSKYELPNFHFEKVGVQKTLFSDDLSTSKKLLKNMPLVDWVELRNNIKKHGLRNSTTFGIIFSDFYSVANECSNSINPYLSYKNNFWIEGFKAEKIAKDLSQQVSDLNETWDENQITSLVPDHFQKIFPKAKDIDPHFLIRLSSVFEKHTDGVVNLKVYFSENTSSKDLKSLILESHKLGNSLFLPQKLNGFSFDFNTKNKKGFVSL